MGLGERHRAVAVRVALLEPFEVVRHVLELARDAHDGLAAAPEQLLDLGALLGSTTNSKTRTELIVLLIGTGVGTAFVYSVAATVAPGWFPESFREHDRVMADTHALALFIAKGLLEATGGAAPAFAPPSFQAVARVIVVSNNSTDRTLARAEEAASRERPGERWKAPQAEAGGLEGLQGGGVVLVQGGLELVDQAGALLDLGDRPHVVEVRTPGAVGRHRG